MNTLVVSRDIEGCITLLNEQGHLVATFPLDRDDAAQYAKLFAESPSLLAALRSLSIVFDDLCQQLGKNAGEYYTYREAQGVVEKAEGICK